MSSNWFLVHRPSGAVVQIVASKADCFPVHKDLCWEESGTAVPAGAQPPDFIFDAELDKIVHAVKDEPPVNLKRRMEYPPIEEQLDQLWHDIDAGLLPGKGTSTWFKAVARVKQKFPKA